MLPGDLASGFSPAPRGRMGRLIDPGDVSDLQARVREIAARAKARAEEEYRAMQRERLIWLQSHPDSCFECRDGGILMGTLNDPCSCAIGHAIVAQRRARSVADIWTAAKIPPRHRTLTLASYPSQHLSALRAMRDFLGRWDGHTGLLLSGAYSTGKTGLMVGLAHAIVTDLYALTPYRVVFRSSVSLLEALRPNGHGPEAEVERENLMRDLMRVRLLLLDDIGKDKPSDWVLDRLFTLIDHRTSHELPTFLTTNYAPDELIERVGEGVVDRLVEACEMIEMDADAPNLRMRGLA